MKTVHGGNSFVLPQSANLHRRYGTEIMILDVSARRLCSLLHTARCRRAFPQPLNQGRLARLAPIDSNNEPWHRPSCFVVCGGCVNSSNTFFQHLLAATYVCAVGELSLET